MRRKGTQHGKNKADGVTAKGNQSVRKDGLRGTTAGADQKGNGDGFLHPPAVHGMDAVAVIMALNLKAASLIAGVAEHAFRRKAFQGMANKLGVGDPQGCEEMVQGL